MSLDDLINDSKGQSSGEEKDSGLSNYFGVKNNVEAFQKEDHCPRCKQDNTEKMSYYWRCKNKDCETITYIPSTGDYNIWKIVKKTS